MMLGMGAPKMSEKTLEKLVPPLELCKKIPEGEFEDSALVWVGDQFYENKSVVDRGYQGIQRDGDIAPAPTAQEILEALPSRLNTPDGDFFLVLLDARSINGNWQIGYARKLMHNGVLEDLIIIKGADQAEIALRLWLELKRQGEENEHQN